MRYYINPTQYESAFAVPASVTDRHLKLASARSIKALLLLCRHSVDGCSPEKIADALGITADDVFDALDYWTQTGVILDREAALAGPLSTVLLENKAAELTVKKAEPIRPATPVRPSREEVARRGSESKEIAFLLNQAQQRFGRMLRPNEASALVGIYDDDGMPVPVILMLLEHLTSKSKATVREIERTAADWCTRSIMSVEAAEQETKALYARQQCWYVVQRTFGIAERQPSERERECAVRWVDQWDMRPELLRAAYDVCIDKKAKLDMSYIDGILKRWQAAGITDTAALKTHLEERRAETDKNKKGAASYDIKLMEDLMEW